MQNLIMSKCLSPDRTYVPPFSHKLVLAELKLHEFVLNNVKTLSNRVKTV